MQRALLLGLGLLAFQQAVYGYGAGAPEGACGDMVPQHHTPEQKTPFPYIIEANKKSIRPGDKVTIIITPDQTVKDFQGFLVQARVGKAPVGKFTASDSVKVINCDKSQGNAATHTKPDKKTKVVIQWTAPPQLTEKVQILVTVAKNGGQFWVRQEGPLINVRK